MVALDDSYAPVPSPDFSGAVSAPVAQLDRALDYESRGREFESLRARQNPERNQALGGSSPTPFPYRSRKRSHKEFSLRGAAARLLCLCLHVEINGGAR